MKYIDTPYLPLGDVKLAISSVEIDSILTISPPSIDILPSGMKTHADVGFCHVGKNAAICPIDTYDYYKKALSPFDFEIILGKKALSCNYPLDSAYNVAIVGKKVICNYSITDSVVIEHLLKRGFEIINVKQGYAKCMVCPVSENAFITSDKGIYTAAKREGMDVLLIKEGFIELSGFEYGFFGGASGMIGKNTLAVCGNLSLHPSCDEIISFLNKYNISIKEVQNNAVQDIGSIIPLIIN